MTETGKPPLNVAHSGDPTGAPLVLLHTIGADLTLWDPLLPHLAPDLSIIRIDLPGYGASADTQSPGRMGTMISAVEATLDALSLREVALLGHGLGGLIAQGLAVKRLDLVRALLLSGTAAKIGTRAQWETLAQSLETEGQSALLDGPAQTWLAPKAPLDQQTALATRLRAQSARALARAAEAIAGTDFYTSTASLRLPLLCLVGANDRFTPPDLVRETADLVPGHQFALIPRAGHLAMVDAPQIYGEKVSKFLKEIGHGAGPF